jgi:hypothetical protein
MGRSRQHSSGFVKCVGKALQMCGERCCSEAANLRLKELVDILGAEHGLDDVVQDLRQRERQGPQQRATVRIFVPHPPTPLQRRGKAASRGPLHS